MKPQLIAGIFAHVDAGKTTLTEALLYEAGCLRTLGRVDEKNSFLDTNIQERERGITIFSKQAILPTEHFQLILTDTPGHVDFSGETERVLDILDYAVLVISANDGVQAHTDTLWQLLREKQIPTILFINKMDLQHVNRTEILAQLQQELSENCLDFSDLNQPDLQEILAMQEEFLLENWLNGIKMKETDIQHLIQRQKVFPCLFGSALKQIGIAEFLSFLTRFCVVPQYPNTFGARVFKITRDAQNNRLTWLKILGGTLQVKQVLHTQNTSSGQAEKVDQIRLYSGDKFDCVPMLCAGSICAVTGFSDTYAGQGFGYVEDAGPPTLQAVLYYRVLLSPEQDTHHILTQLLSLQEEEPQLNIVWNSEQQEIGVHVMGEIQLEILQRLFWERFQTKLSFDTGRVTYQETITAPVEGVGHFEPLRHYAEVRVVLSPAERNSGIQIVSQCQEDVISPVWQNHILASLAEKKLTGVLTGSMLTDVTISLVNAKMHLQHTDGGDFRQAANRAVRHALMHAENILLEPWYAFQLKIPQEYIGRAMSDIQRMGGFCEPFEQTHQICLLKGEVPVCHLRSYSIEVASYTHGKGRLSYRTSGMKPCHNTKEIIAEFEYDPLRDIENTPNSIFCANGSGYSVSWQEVEQYAHTPRFFAIDNKPPNTTAPTTKKKQDSLAYDAELALIFERTYGKAQRTNWKPVPLPAVKDTVSFEPVTEYLLVDGYNVLFAWEDLYQESKHHFESARQKLADILCNYRAYRQCEVLLIFDAYRVKGNPGTIEKYHNIYLIYTKEAETADLYIEKITYQLARKRRVRVATSDHLEQMIITGHGALQISAQTLKEEIERTEQQIQETLAEHNRRNNLHLQKEQ